MVPRSKVQRPGDSASPSVSDRGVQQRARLWKPLPSDEKEWREKIGNEETPGTNSGKILALNDLSMKSETGTPHICFVIPSLLDGGAQRVLVEVANELCGRYPVSVITFDKATPYYPLNSKVSLTQIGNVVGRWPGKGLYNLVRRLLVLARRIRRIDPDVVVSFLDIASVNVLLANLGSRKPLILSEHCNPIDSLLSPAQKHVRRLLYRRATAIVSPTREGFEIFANLGIHLPGIRKVIINPLPADLMPTTDVLLPQREKVVLFVGRLSPEKQIDHLIHIFGEAHLPGWKLHIIGDGPERSALEAQARALPNSRSVAFLGSQKNLAHHYQSARFIALTSRTEGLSNVLLEGMANGCVPISYDCRVGPSTLIRHGVSGVLIPPQDKAAFSSELVSLASDTARCSAMQREAVKLVSEVNVQRVAAEWAGLFDQVIRGDKEPAHSR